MEISEETQKSSFQAMGDEDLIRRWNGELTEMARSVAKSEIESRGLDVSGQAFEHLLAQDHEDNLAIKRRQRTTIFKMVIRLFLGILATAGAAIAALILGHSR